MNNSLKPKLLVAAVVCFLATAVLQIGIDPMRKQFEPADQGHINEIGSKLPIAFTLGAATGFREAIASMLWVRTDSFFHDGNYQAIVPMIRIITWLDPHDIDVYRTGAWHLDYNFTDNQERSDRRYLPMSISLLEEGIKNNPSNADLYADISFVHYCRKMANFQRAAEWYKKCLAIKIEDPKLPLTTDPDTGIKGHYRVSKSTGKPYSIGNPTNIMHGLAHALEESGDIDGALKEWKVAEAAHVRDMADDPNSIQYEKSQLQVCKDNYARTLLRQKYRKTDTKPPVNFKMNLYLEREKSLDFWLKGTVNVIGAQDFVLETHKVKWGPLDGARVNIQIQDADYEQPQVIPFDINLKMPKDVTIIQDSATIRKGEVKRAISVFKDEVGDNPFYPFKAQKYKVTIWFNPEDPATCPEPLQDRIGWYGEGMTDDHFVDNSGKVPGSLQRPDEKVNCKLLKQVFYLTRDDIMGNTYKQFR